MKFSVFGDLHFSKNYQEVDNFEAFRDQYYRHFMDVLFQQAADYYISIGDLTNSGHPEELRDIYALISEFDSQGKFLHVPGNHDNYASSKEDLKSALHNDLYFTIDAGEFCLIFLDTNRDQVPEDWSGTLDDEQFNWFKSVMADNQDKTIVIFAHHPVYGTTNHSTDNKASIVPEIPIKDVLDQHPGKGFFINGHVHVDSIVEMGNWHYIQIAAILDQPSVRNIEITSDSFSIESVDIEEEYRQIGSFLGCRMNYFKLSPYGYQGQENRNFHINY